MVRKSFGKLRVIGYNAIRLLWLRGLVLLSVVVSVIYPYTFPDSYIPVNSGDSNSYCVHLQQQWKK